MLSIIGGQAGFATSVDARAFAHGPARSRNCKRWAQKIFRRAHEAPFCCREFTRPAQVSGRIILSEFNASR